MKVVFIPMHYDRDWSWIQLLFGIAATDKTKGIVAVREYEDGKTEPVAVAVFDNWTHNSVCVHWWLDTPMVLRHGFFEEVAHYVFNVCGKRIMIGLVPSDKPKSIKLAKHLGFEEVYRVKDGYAVGIDQVILEGRVENADRWLGHVATEEAA